MRRSEQEEKQRKNRQSTGKDQTDRAKHGKFSLWLRSIVAHYPAKGKHLVGLALVVDGDRELRSGRGLSLQRDFANDSAKVTHQQLS